MSLRNIESRIPNEMRKPYLQKPPEQEQEQRSIPTGVICSGFAFEPYGKTLSHFAVTGEGGVNGTHNSAKRNNDSAASSTTTRGVKVFGDSILLYWILIRCSFRFDFS